MGLRGDPTTCGKPTPGFNGKCDYINYSNFDKFQGKGKGKNKIQSCLFLCFKRKQDENWRTMNTCIV